jgi:hypothetical protein
MNLQYISEKISGQQQLVEDDIQLIKELKNKYPYSEIFQLLDLQITKEFNPLFIEDLLIDSAYKIRDRKKIIEILEQKPIEVNQVEQESDKVSQKEISSQEDLKVEVKEEIISNVDINLEEKVELPIPEEPENNTLDQQIAAEALSSIFSINFEPTIQHLIEEEHTIEIEETPNSTIEYTKEEEKKEEQSNVRSFTSWLKSNNKENKKDKNELIDTIIATNPTISKSKKEFYNPNKQALKSVDEDQLVYSETLAKIIEMQGNYSKAISAYEQLCLTIPEKKTFFVQKIKELNEKLNSK